MISIIIPTYNRDEMLNLTLSSLVQVIDGIDAEIIVVNDCPERVPQVNGKFLSNVKIVNNPKKGVGAARNYGVETSRGEYIIFMDDDFLISKESILGLVKLLIIHPDKVFNPSWIYPPDLLEDASKMKFGRYIIREGFTSLKDRMKDYGWINDSIFERVNGLSSGLLAISRENFIKTGGYDTDMVFGNDRDFSLRIKASGIKLYIAPFISAFHNERDKLNLHSWLNRRKFGVQQLVKHKMVAIPNYNPIKKILLKLFSRYKNVLFFIENYIPNKKYLDWLYSKVLNILFAVYLFEAYTEK
ncbi:glycosyltransferase family 2 protein [Rufibacter immobilis]|uniref:Glycosyltransferase family 2 protein n=1 Tax=Rufibacter immobilis TaxID=1348778 RepID=A0A3M9MZ77_9BACT|nr:glycosyltransferase family 2 protein [Rufibacter immobilis]RNI30862.1 glycosyltransferase family 2 protein [Rufibacter immobilis]